MPKSEIKKANTAMEPLVRKMENKQTNQDTPNCKVRQQHIPPSLGWLPMVAVIPVSGSLALGSSCDK